MMPIPSSSSSSTTSSSFELQLPGQKAGCKTLIYSSYELLSTGFLAISAAWSKFGGLVVFFRSAVGHGPTYISQIPSPKKETNRDPENGAFNHLLPPVWGSMSSG